jgi:hypothetical protein
MRDLALLHGNDAPADMLDNAGIMRREQDGRAEIVDFFQNLHHLVRIGRIEVSRRLIGNDEIRLIDDGTRDGDALLFSAGELVRKGVHLAMQVYEFEHMGHVGGDFLIRTAGCLHGEGHVLICGLVRQKPEILKNRAYSASVFVDFPLVEIGDVQALKKYLPVGWLLFRQNHLEHGRLAGTGMAHYGHEFLGLYVQGDSVECQRIVGIQLGNVFESKHEIHFNKLTWLVQ